MQCSHKDVFGVQCGGRAMRGATVCWAHSLERKARRSIDRVEAQRRVLAGESRSAVARSLGVSRQYVSKACRGV